MNVPNKEKRLNHNIQVDVIIQQQNTRTSLEESEDNTNNKTLFSQAIITLTDRFKCVNK